MRRWLVLLWIGQALALAATGSAGGRKCKDPEYRGTYVCRQIVIKHDQRFDAAAFSKRFAVRYRGTIGVLGTSWFEAEADIDSKTLLAEIKRYRETTRDSGIKGQELNPIFIEPECQQINVSILEFVEGVAAAAVQPALSAMKALPADSRRGINVTVAVLDTGVSRRHPAFGGSLLSPGIDVMGGTTLADDIGNQIDDDIPPDGNIDEGVGHGTSVAGVIRLIAPAAHILPVKVLDDECKASAFEVAAGIVAAVDAGAHVINLSLGTDIPSSVVEDAAHWASKRGVLIVASAGNSVEGGKDSQRMSFPAASEIVLAVTAVGSDLRAPDWAVASGGIAMCAPGVAIVAPYREGYAVLDGASVAAAWVSGAAAVALGYDPSLNRARLIRRLKTKAISVDRCNRKLKGKLGAGIPDIEALSR